jgi:uncharacterized membrane protein
MDALSEALVRLLKRQAESERRLAEIEKVLRIERVEAPQPEKVPEPAALPPQPPPLRIEIPPLPSAEVPPPLPVSPAEPEPPRLETTLGLAWVNRIGALTLALCVAFIFKYAVDNAWIGPAGRVALGVLAGLAALAAADWTWRGGQKTYAQGIAGLGLAILYLSFYASFGFYHLVEPGMAFVLMVLTTAMSAVIALRYDAQAIAALGLLGGYATPLLLSTGEDRPWVLFSYVLALNLGALWASRLRKWKGLEVLAFLATVTLYGGWMDDRFRPEKRTVAALFGYIYYALFASSELPPIFFLSQALIMLAMPQIWKEMTGGYALSALLLAACSLVIGDWRNRAGAAGLAFAAFWMGYAAWVSGFHFQPNTGEVFLFLTAAFALFLSWILWRFLVRKTVLTRTDALLLALNGAAYFGVSYDLLQKDYQPYLGLFAVAVAAAHLLVAYLLWRALPPENRDTRGVLLAIGIALTFLTLAAPIQFAGYRITMAWALEMAALAWIGSRANSKAATYAAMVVFWLVLARLHHVDAWMYGSPTEYNLLANARFLTFVIAAAAAWASAFWTAEEIRVIFYLGGHYVMLFALGFEALAWVARNVAPENLTSAQSAAISILTACYALLLIAAGVLYRSTIERIVGLGLIALVIGKLYFYDVWLLVRIYRIVAFGVLGALLLLTSYVYSRNRVSIESWWNERNSRP